MPPLSTLLQYLLPHHLLGAVVYALTRARARWFKNTLIRLFVRGYRPSMSEAIVTEPTDYPCFNDFFIRALRPGARPLDPQPQRIASPCDGTLSIAATISANTLIQAKGHSYGLNALLAQKQPWLESLNEGLYATIYLAPYNYHRIHMPLDGRLRAAWHVPGRLFSVNAAAQASIPGLFARNERLVCAFDGDHGPFVVIMVGALFVGSMSTIWHGQVTPWAGDHQMLRPRTGAELWQPRGAELGHFNMGSTVILLLPRATATWDPHWQPGTRLLAGQGLGSLRS